MKFLLLYNGPKTPPDASHVGWPAWFAKIGSALVDTGRPLSEGVTVHHDGSTTQDAPSLNGYSIVEAKSRDEVLELIKDHPYLQLGDEYTIEVFVKG